METLQHEFGGFYSAAQQRTSFQHHAAITCFRKIRGGDETVVATTSDHDVKAIAACLTRTLRRRASFLRVQIGAEPQMRNGQRRNGCSFYEAASGYVLHRFSCFPAR